ncbi:MAG TPA: hypothetical protein VGY96_04905 [Streptosporangiaceae bacterium]|nr:hypothetical protein [Streptosporangiaceae bacterium]
MRAAIMQAPVLTARIAALFPECRCTARTGSGGLVAGMSAVTAASSA